MTSLDRYGDDEMAALYDLRFGDHADDMAMYEGFARRGETAVLELGVGSGRVALHLARLGFDVVGVDASPHMLARLRAKLDEATAPHVRIVEADMRDFHLGERFDVAFCAVGTFQYLLRTDEQLAALRCVADHLTPGGLFVAELRAPWSVDWDAEPSPLQLRWTHVDATSGETITETVSRRASPSQQTVTVTYLYDIVAPGGAVRRRMVEKTMRYVWPSELTLLFERAGLRLERLYGGTDLSPLTDDSETMVVTAGPHP